MKKLNASELVIMHWNGGKEQDLDDTKSWQRMGYEADCQSKIVFSFFFLFLLPIVLCSSALNRHVILSLTTDLQLRNIWKSPSFDST